MQFNVDPYYDDFQQNALNNNYVRILFKPGQAVQARELTQIQSILQNQIKQFGDHIFQDGSPVIGGNLTLDNRVQFLKLEETYNNEDVDVAEFENRVIRNSTGTIQAKVLTTYAPVDGTPTLIVRYLTGNEFANDSVIRIAGTSIEAKLISSAATGSALICSINEGVFYVDGFFVQVGNQSTVINAYDITGNAKVGLEITDDIIDSITDTTLLDPAQGSFNYQAPGADRYQFNLTLTTRPLDSPADESKFFELMRVENGAITKQVKYPVYAELEKTLARRTFDESGDYLVRPFRATINDGADANNYVISIEPGKAYVKGFEFETIGTQKVTVSKPRTVSDIKSLVDVDVDTSYGNFVYATSIRGTDQGFIDISGLEKVDMHIGRSNCIYATGAGKGIANAFIYSNTKIGTARVKTFSRHVPDTFDSTLDSNGVYKLYLTDINIEPKVLKVKEASPNAQTIVMTTEFCSNVLNFINVSVTVLPVRLDAVPHVNVANVFVNSYRLNANSAVSSVFLPPNVAPGSVIRVGDMVREVVSINTAGDYVTVNRAWDKTIVATSSTTNPLSVLVQTPYGQNVASQSRTITSAANNTTNLHFVLDRPFDNFGVPDQNTVVQFNYGFKDVRSFCSGPVVSNVLNGFANVSMNIALPSVLINNETVIEDPQRNLLIFKLPGTFVRRSSINNADYNHFKLVKNRPADSPGIFIVGQNQGLLTGETVALTDSTSSIQDNLIFIVRNNSGNPSYPNGSILQLTSNEISIASPPTSITIDTGISDITSADIIINVKQNDAEGNIKTKILRQNTLASLSPFTYPSTTATSNVTVTLPNLGEVARIDIANGFIWLTNPEYNNINPGDSISLFIPDVINIRRIIAGNAASVPDSDNARDITNSFLIDYGQRDDRYEHAKIVLKSGFDSPSAKILVHADFFQHVSATASNVTFFSADSYDPNLYENNSIPIYNSANGDIYYLRDCLDFRPSLPIGSTSGVFNVPNIPTPDEVTELSHDYYLPRIDKLVLSKEKEFRIISGKSAPNPLPPEDIDDAMTLYQIRVPAYASDIREFDLRYVDNRRLTMKDLANLEKRVESLEFYTSLNNVELLALSDKTAYEDGTEKEKFGIVGENFSNFNIADYKSADFGVALDNGFMLPAMYTSTYDFKNILNAGTKKNKKTISLNYTEAPAIVQGLASDNAVSVQPFLFGSFNGFLELAPETDYWISESLKPEIISVPERIIEHHHVIREIIKEPPAPITIVNNYPVTNVINQIIINPGDDPPPVDPPTKVIVNPPEPPVVILPVPTPPDPPPPPPPPPPPKVDPPFKALPVIDPPLKVEFDPCFSFSINFTFGVTGAGSRPGCEKRHGGAFKPGGSQDFWFPKPDIPVTIPTPPVVEPKNPTVAPSIPLVSKKPSGSGGGGGGIGRAALNFGDRDLRAN